MEKYSTGLTLERVTKMNEHEFEFVLNGLTLDYDTSNPYILATDFSGNFNVRFFAEDHLGVRKLIGIFDFSDY